MLLGMVMGHSTVIKLESVILFAVLLLTLGIASMFSRFRVF